MQDFGTKADNSPPPGGQLSASEFNNLATENENAVLRSGQALSGASATQLAQSLFLHGVKSETFQDSGAANAYVATPVSGTNGVLLPTSYANMDGAIISFRASNANTGASTLNIGQTTGTLIGAKPIRAQGDVALPAGVIVSGRHVQLIYSAALDSGNGAWEVLPWANGSVNVQVFNTSGTYVPTPGMKYAIADVVAGGGQGGGSPAGNATQLGFGTGGHSGSRLVGSFSLAGITSLAIGVGLGGSTSGAGATGQTGGTSSVGTIITCAGGAGGGPVGPTAGPSIIANASAYPNPSSTGAVTVIISQPGNGGTAGQAITGGIGISGVGGCSPAYGINISANIGTGTGSPGTQRGQGGSGAFSAISAAAQVGGAGAPGKVVIWEFP